MSSPLCILAVALCLMPASYGVLERKNVEKLSIEDTLSLQTALREVNADTSGKGYSAIAGYHGYPANCKDGDRDVACCVHGSPMFPQWHRLYVVQLEQALKEKGLDIGVPYWDWTRPLTGLPDLVNQQIFIDSDGGKASKNIWHQGEIKLDDRTVYTARALDDRLFQQVSAGENTDLFEMVLNALEYHNYCQFEVQFEVAHNTIHYLVGGRHTYSMSNLDYTSYDPIFFLHHSNVDKIYSIFEKLTEARGYNGRGACTGECEYCDIQAFNTLLEPFSWESNPVDLTRTNSAPIKVTLDPLLDYKFDNLTLNDLSIDELEALIRERKSHDRAFANFRLGGIGGSANVRVEVCVAEDDMETAYCEFAGDFFILGGSTEMAWSFSYPYFFEITKTVQGLGLPLDGNYFVRANVFHVNGTQLPSDVIPAPSVDFRPAEGKTDEPIPQRTEYSEGTTMRKNIDRLTEEEVYELRKALQRFQNDRSTDGYQAIAEFHGDPGKCPYPSAENRQACCNHGMPNFPHWHRLLVVQVENALRRRGSPVGVPYWDWTKPSTVIPRLARDETYKDPISGEVLANPFYSADVAFLKNGAKTSRDVQEGISQIPEWGDHTDLFDAYLLALEQDNFCNFEVQFEVAHNMIHALVGGTSEYGMSSLSYSAYDPIFYLHHSNVDRLWAIWTALQQLRGKPYKAHCAQSYAQTPLKPFAFSSPLNNDQVTYAHSKPTNIYNYEDELNYAYDSLEFGGMGINELEDYINKNLKGKNRYLVGIMLGGIAKSALGKVYIQSGDTKTEAATFAILGGPSEMPWKFDREYRLDVTSTMADLNLNFGSSVDISVELFNLDGSPLEFSGFPKPKLIFKGAEGAFVDQRKDLKVRKNVDQLNFKETLNLRRALASLKEDTSQGGYQNLGRFHGAALWCPSPEAEKKFACCLHGMAVFPHWHRLLVVQAENALKRHGYEGGLPYWDWTRPLKELPKLASEPTYVDLSNLTLTRNPFYSAHIDDADQDTSRNPRQELFEQPPFGQYTAKAKQVLLALEQEDFCDFEVQYEIAHNFIHVLVGGTDTYSMANLKYTAYDPLFFLHHSNVDRIWAIWQALQKYRGKPYNTANCAVGQMRQTLAPFSLTSDINPDSVTREQSRAFQAFDYRNNFEYEYDSLEFNGLTVPQIIRLLEQNKAEDRVFVGFMLRGIKASALVQFQICKSEHSCRKKKEEFYILGSEVEMPWAYDRLYKYEITDQIGAYGLRHNDRYIIKYKVTDLEGNDLGQPFPTPTVLFELGTSHLFGQEYREAVTTASHVRKDLTTLTEGETESLRAAFLAIEKDQTYENIAAYHGRPGLCEVDGEKVACCVHGMATFPHWHRLYVAQVEEALLARGSAVAVPYWDWTEPITKLPALINQATYFNSRLQTFDPNPFFSASVKGEDAVTTRDPQPQLFNNNYFYDATLLALEQTNFCDFEIQFEIVHNALHSWIGGRAKYSMSSLDYTAFDPLFFLHHSNADRIWAIWQELQRNRGLPYNEADCAINMMRKPLEPFSNQNLNDGDLTYRYSRPADVFDYRNNLGYEYDTLEFHDMNIPQLENFLKQRQERGRVFAGFLLHNIGLSADVEIYICVPSGPKQVKNCDNKAGTFSVLGGELEMPYMFDRLYKHDITKAVRDLGLQLNNAANFELKISIRAVNGSYISSSGIPKPTVFFQPGTKERQEPDGAETPYMVRRNINSLSPMERESLVKAMASLQADSSADGYQSIASFHALPPLCPSPSASKRYACCPHGMPTFLQWHRLYTVQVEDALRRQGSLVGIPYWDWSRQFENIPDFFGDNNYIFAESGIEIDNPWFRGEIEFENGHTERHLDNKLFEEGPNGWDTWLFNQTLFALEQDNYCDFALQLEITHNAIHFWLGGARDHSLSHLHYASYDPAFYIHHSNTDRIWALWQALQAYRGKNPNEVNCALEQMKKPLKPFSFGSPYNLNPKTKEFSKPQDTFDYKNHLGYRYDDLEFVGMSVPKLDNYIKEVQSRDRVFAGGLLKGFGKSAMVEFEILDSNKKRHPGGYFFILGGSAEMPWVTDRQFKYEITSQLNAAGLRYDDDYTIDFKLKDTHGREMDASIIPAPNIVRVTAKSGAQSVTLPPNKVRRNLNTLSERDVQSLEAALRDLQEDTSLDGWANIASFHGAPARCDGDGGKKEACCIHGMPTFPHWHRLFTLQVEQALQRHGSAIAIPYWDWTMPFKGLPDIFTTETYYDVWRDEVVSNPFVRGYVPSEQTYTVRDIRPEIYRTCPYNDHNAISELVILALEQTDYCDFEVQFEVMHNAIHYLIGGQQTYSLSSLEYSAYDPLFFLHHSFTDKIWAIWQELQKLRQLPSHRADCAVNYMSSPMRPFDFADININQFTRDHAVPNTVFDYLGLGYTYDDFTLGGKDVAGIEEIINYRKTKPRIFAGFLLHGIKTSGSVSIDLCVTNAGCTYAGYFNLLGGPTEMPWAFDRLFKYDITPYLKEAGLNPEDLFDAESPFKLDIKVYDVEGNPLSLKEVMPEPTIIFQPGAGAAEDFSETTLSGVAVRKDVSTLTASETKSLRDALGKMQADTGPNGFVSIASFHGLPTSCEVNGQQVACCQHGMATFPQWHRLFIKQFEDALTAQGAKTGIPYWDWTDAFTELPSLVTETKNNPFHHGVTFDGFETTRSPRDKLFNDPHFGDKSFFYRQTILAFEQTDYCDFEVQFELNHNAIHSWTGGNSPYGMSTLEYTAYDPLFMLHHSNVDRQFAIWQALQKFRGLPYNSANCAIQLLKKDLEPFCHDSNVNPTTRTFSKAKDAFNYQNLNYQYDDLNFHGLTISELNDVLEKTKEEDRIFAEFLLKGFGASADVNFNLCAGDGRCSFAGTFAVLGGSAEMPWALDRRFKYDVTNVFDQMHLKVDDEYYFEVEVVGVDGTKLDSSLVPTPSVEFVPGLKGFYDRVAAQTVQRSDNLIRKDINRLSLGETANLRDALYKLQGDTGPNGYEAIAGFHGAPYRCPANSTDKYACCAHGMPIFPHWHRLHTVQFEQALKDNGALVGIPYWDWTTNVKALPTLFADRSDVNPFYKYYINFERADTQRDVQTILYDLPNIQGHNKLFYMAMMALEEENFCDFEVHYEMVHNEVHALIGGSANFSMFSLDYSAFDPFFMILHSSIDRIWLIWQELQKLRRKPFNYATCGGRIMNQPLIPFSYPSVNKNDFTRLNSNPGQLFDNSRLGYQYDKLELNGHDVSMINDDIQALKRKNRLFLCIILQGQRLSGTLKMELLNDEGEAFFAGTISWLGGMREMPWAYERPFKWDITEVARDAGFSPAKLGRARYTGATPDGKRNIDVTLNPILLERPLNSNHDILTLPLNHPRMPPKLILKKGTRVRFVAPDGFQAETMENLGSLSNYARCTIPPFSFNSYPINEVSFLDPGDYYFVAKNEELCKAGKKIVIRIEED